MAKAVQHPQPLLCVPKTCVFAIKVVLGELLETGEHLLKRFLRINEHRPFPIAEEKVMRRLTSGGLPLPRSQPPEEGF